METLSLLKYWKGAGGGCSAPKHPAAETATVDTGAGGQAAVEAEEDANDDGPFFDLEFDTVPGEVDGDGGEEVVGVYGGEDGSEGGGRDEGGDQSDEDDDNGEEEKQEDALSSRSACDGSPRDRSLSLSPSDDLFKGRLVSLDSSSSSLLTLEDSEANPKNQFHVSLLKPATKLRVFMLRFKKSKTVMEKADTNASAAPKPETAAEPEAEAVAESSPRRRNPKEQSKQSKLLVVKFKVEEVPIVSLFTRDGSSRTSTGAGNGDEKRSAGAADLPAADDSGSEEKRFSKDVLVPKYLKAIKPLYVRASKKYAEKLKLSGMLKLGSGLNLKCGAAPAAAVAAAAGETSKESPPASRKTEEEANVLNLRNIPAGFRVVRKRLGKSRSASAASAAVAAATSKRRDDTLLEQEDGIQSAILHCKKSFNGSSPDSESTHLSRSSSEPSPEVMPGEPAAVD